MSLKCLFLMIFLIIILNSANGNNQWAKIGCHKVGHTRKISIPDCVEFQMTTNACRGFCESFAVPSTFAIGIHRPEQPVTSVGQCCNIMDTEDVMVKVRCLDGEFLIEKKMVKILNF